MRKYKLVNLLEKKSFSKRKELEEAENILNQYASEGWILQEMSNLYESDLIAVMYKEY